MTGYQSKKAAAQDKLDSMKDEALKLALEALEAGEYYIDDLEAIVYAADDIGTHEDRAKMQAAITVLRLEIDALNMASKPALAEQPAQQEPVACKHEWFRTGAMEPRECRCIKCGAWNTTPPQRTWVGLTEEETLGFTQHEMSVVKYVNKVLQEKNT